MKYKNLKNYLINTYKFKEESIIEDPIRDNQCILFYGGYKFQFKFDFIMDGSGKIGKSSFSSNENPMIIVCPIEPDKHKGNACRLFTSIFNRNEFNKLIEELNDGSLTNLYRKNINKTYGKSKRNN